MDRGFWALSFCVLVIPWNSLTVWLSSVLSLTFMNDCRSRFIRCGFLLAVKFPGRDRWTDIIITSDIQNDHIQSMEYNDDIQNESTAIKPIHDLLQMTWEERYPACKVPDGGCLCGAAGMLGIVFLAMLLGREGVYILNRFASMVVCDWFSRLCPPQFDVYARNVLMNGWQKYCINSVCLGCSCILFGVCVCPG